MRKSAMSPAKSIAWLVAGGVAGALGAEIVSHGNGGDAVVADTPTLVDTVSGFAFGRSDGARASDAPAVAERLDIYREALEQTDPEAIARELERAIGRRWSPALDLEIDALLGRL